MITNATKKVVPLTDKISNAARDAARPYRLWNVKLKQNMRWRYYKDKRNAHIGALIEARWECKPGEAIEVYDARNGRMICQYVRTVDGVRCFEGGK